MGSIKKKEWESLSKSGQFECYIHNFKAYGRLLDVNDELEKESMEFEAEIIPTLPIRAALH